MDIGLLPLLTYGVIAGLANVLGGLILFPSSLQGRYKGLLKYVLALGAGFMLAVTFFEIIPKTITIWQKTGGSPTESLSIPMVLVLAGYLLTQFFEHAVAPHFHLGEDVHADAILSARSAYSAIGGLLVHTFFDGVAIAAALQIDRRVGLLVFIAVVIHKIPEGFTIGSVVIAAGKKLSQVITTTSIVGLMTVVGVILYYLIGTNVGFTLGYALPIASGVTLYVAASDLIPEVNHHGGRRPLISISIFTGVALFFLLHFLLDSVFAD
jgi:zinc transporter ZupT